MLTKRPVQSRIRTRTILIGVFLFVVIAICSSEVQRRSLIYRIQNMISQQEEARKAETASFQTNLVDQRKRLADLQSSVGALQLLVKDGHFASRQEIQSAIGKRLIDGKSIILRFNDSEFETRDGGGAILCGPEAEGGHLGVFVAGQQYTISYDHITHQWTGSGPVRSKPNNKDSTSCLQNVGTYGPKEMGKSIDPDRALVLWGAQLKLDGLDLLLEGRRVGRIVWVN